MGRGRDSFSERDSRSGRASATSCQSVSTHERREVRAAERIWGFGSESMDNRPEAVERARGGRGPPGVEK